MPFVIYMYLYDGAGGDAGDEQHAGRRCGGSCSRQAPGVEGVRADGEGAHAAAADQAQLRVQRADVGGRLRAWRLAADARVQLSESDGRISSAKGVG